MADRLAVARESRGPVGKVARFCCSRIARQRFVRGSRQCTQVPHCGEKSVTTWSPAASELTPCRRARRLPPPRGRARRARSRRGRRPRPCRDRCGRCRRRAGGRAPRPPAARRARAPETTSGAPNSSRTAARTLTAAAFRSGGAGASRVQASPAAGKLMSTRSPPPGRGRATRIAEWAWAIARTIERPSPRPPSLAVRSASRRWNGWKSRSISCGGDRRPGVRDGEDASCSVGVAVRDLDPAAGAGCGETALLDQVRDAAARPDVASPLVRAGPSAALDRQAVVVGRLASPSAATAARSTGSCRSSPRWLRERVRSASISRSCCSPAASTCSQVSRRAATRRRPGRRARPRPAPARASAACAARARRSRRTGAARRTTPSSRSSRPSKVFPSCLSSSSGPARSRRRCRLARRDVARGVRDRAQRPQRPPGDSQPSQIESSAMIASAITDWTRSCVQRRAATAPAPARASELGRRLRCPIAPGEGADTVGPPIAADRRRSAGRSRRSSCRCAGSLPCDGDHAGGDAGRRSTKKPRVLMRDEHVGDPEQGRSGEQEERPVEHGQTQPDRSRAAGAADRRDGELARRRRSRADPVAAVRAPSRSPAGRRACAAAG